MTFREYVARELGEWPQSGQLKPSIIPERFSHFVWGSPISWPILLIELMAEWDEKRTV